MTLWTAQSEDYYLQLLRDGRIRSKWKRSWSLARPAFVWMARQMVERGICRRPVAPVWAWQSCGAPGGKPTTDDWEALMGSAPYTVRIIEFDAPDDFVLLSEYHVWNKILDEVIEAGRDADKLDPVARDWGRVFDIEGCLVELRSDFADWNPEDDAYEIQACLPHLCKAWIRNVETWTPPDHTASRAGHGMRADECPSGVHDADDLPPTSPSPRVSRPGRPAVARSCRRTP